MPGEQIKIIDGNGFFPETSSGGGSSDVISALYKPNILTLEGRNFPGAFEDSAGNQSDIIWNAKDADHQKFPVITPKNSTVTVAAGQTKTIRAAIEPFGATCDEILQGSMKGLIMKELERELVNNPGNANYTKISIDQDPSTEKYCVMYRSVSGNLYVRQATIDATTGAVTLQAALLISSVTNTNATYNDVCVKWFAAASRFVMAYSNASNYGYLRNLAINGTTFTIGSAYTIHSTNVAGKFDIVCDDAGQDGVLAWIRAGSYCHAIGFRCNASTSMTLGGLFSGASGRNTAKIAKSGTDNQFMAIYGANAGFYAYRLTLSNYTVSGGTVASTTRIRYQADIVWDAESNQFLVTGYGYDTIESSNDAVADLCVLALSNLATPVWSTDLAWIGENDYFKVNTSVNYRDICTIMKNNKMYILAKNTSQEVRFMTVDIAASGTELVATVEKDELVATSHLNGNLFIVEGDSELALVFSDASYNYYLQAAHTTGDIGSQVGASYTETKTINGAAITDWNDLEDTQIDDTKILIEWSVTNTHGSLDLEFAFGCISGGFGFEKTYENPELSLLFKQ